ncbi:MAG TPA: patatin-like phospholipase family protein [Candidatus Dormibacteraeota bacterium]|nr:patatin-like phospholipase family protein [Candidatus Dormibacteraeota bacterium]
MTKQLDGVFEGGGVRGIGLVGALSVIEEAGYEFVNLAGTSAGAIVSTLIAAGYKAAEIRAIIDGIDFKRMTDDAGFGRVPFVGKWIELLLHDGMYRGDYLLNLMRDLLARKGKRTFGDLRMPEFDSEPRYRFKVRVVASDISRGRMAVLPDDIADYGLVPDELEIALAVRMSMSIPFFFRPVKQSNQEGSKSFVVDGGVLSNFPVELFDSTGVPEWPTFGFRLVETLTPPVIQHQVTGPISMLRALFETMTEAHDARYIETHKFVRTITIDTHGIPATKFTLTPEDKALLYDSGQQAARDFLSQWDFAAYKLAFRSGAAPPSRRDMVRGALSRSVTRPA